MFHQERSDSKRVFDFIERKILHNNLNAILPKEKMVFLLANYPE
jgi:hypothetical protein